MSEIKANRTLVKSPPELWAELSDPESLARHLGEFGEIRITRTEPETTVAWEGEQVRGTVTIAASGWGTEVSLSARIAVPEPEPPRAPPPPERIEHTVRVVDEEVVRVEPPPVAEPEPEPEPEPVAMVVAAGPTLPCRATAASTIRCRVLATCSARSRIWYRRDSSERGCSLKT